MSRLTLRLPDTLHRQLSKQAEREGISLNQYIVYALTREATLATLSIQYLTQIHSRLHLRPCLKNWAVHLLTRFRLYWMNGRPLRRKTASAQR